jgi:hypothetical protein
MAHDSIVANLFGIDPALLGQQQQAQDNVFGMQMAQLAPEQAAAAPVYSMTQNLGRQVGSLLGIEDPAVAENSRILAVKKKAREMGLDPQTSSGLQAYAKLLSDAGMEDKAMQAGQKAQQMAEQEAKTGKAQGDLLKEAQFRKAMASLDPTSPTYQEDLMKVASQFGSADKVMDVHMKSLDKQERIQAKKDEMEAKLAQQMEIAKANNASREQIAQMQIEGRKDIQAMIAAMRQGLAASSSGGHGQRAVPVTIIDPNNPNQQITVDANTYDPKTGAGVLGVSGRLSDAAKAEQKNKVKMGGAEELIDEAEAILNGPVKPTNSLAGSLYDKAASVIGSSPEGAAEADKLKVIGGALVSKMPRMEGPQSDKDTVLYREMAGRVGDDTLPVARRKAALETVKQLYVKYAPTNTTPVKATVSVDALLEKYK